VADQRDSVEERLARLRGATEGLSPPSGLGARLAARAMAPRPATGLSAVILPFARTAIVAAALAAAASVSLAVHLDGLTDQRLDDALEAMEP
jgi:hypothetical protein